MEQAKKYFIPDNPSLRRILRDELHQRFLWLVDRYELYNRQIALIEEKKAELKKDIADVNGHINAVADALLADEHKALTESNL